MRFIIVKAILAAAAEAALTIVVMVISVLCAIQITSQALDIRSGNIDTAFNDLVYKRVAHPPESQGVWRVADEEFGVVCMSLEEEK